MGDYRRLKVLRRMHAVTCELYRVIGAMPITARIGLGQQILDAALSVGATLVEGSGSNGDREFARYVRISLASANELTYLLTVARDVRFLPKPLCARLIDEMIEIRRMESGLLATLRTSKVEHRKPSANKRAPIRPTGSKLARLADS